MPAMATKHPMSTPDSDRPWSGPERRSLNEDTVRLMIKQDVEDAIKESQDELRTHMDEKFKELREFVASAFPNGDPTGHRQAHEKAIRDADWWAKFKLGLFEKIVLGGVMGAVAFLGAAAWEHFKTALGLK